MSTNMGARIHTKEMLQHSHLAFSVEWHKSPSVGDPTISCFLSSTLVCTPSSHPCLAPISLIMFKKMSYMIIKLKIWNKSTEPLHELVEKPAHISVLFLPTHSLACSWFYTHLNMQIKKSQVSHLESNFKVNMIIALRDWLA